MVEQDRTETVMSQEREEETVQCPWKIRAKTSKVPNLPGSPMVKNPPCNARDTGLIPGPGRSHVPQSIQAGEPQERRPSSGAREPQLLRLHTTTTEAECLEPMLRNRRSSTVRSPCSTAGEWAPLAAARGKPNTAMKTQHSQKEVSKQMSLKKDKAQSNIHKWLSYNDS
ncbi:hypothetical protein MJT46_000009 [Ovis ammon polii x Ovis aries]|nr:hypothetical protein MJT46_000009 [Ovis ammon polii x Ovis aries]